MDATTIRRILMQKSGCRGVAYSLIIRDHETCCELRARSRWAAAAISFPAEVLRYARYPVEFIADTCRELEDALEFAFIERQMG